MAQVDNTCTVAKADNTKTFWCASMWSNDADTTGNLTVKAAPSSGNLYLEHVMIMCDADLVSVQINDDSNALIGPWEMSATETSGVIDIRLIRPLKLSGALKVDASTNAPLHVLAEGFTV